MVTNRFARSMRWLAGACCAAAMLMACQASMEEVIAEHRPAVEAVFAQLRTLQIPALNAPPLVEDGVELGTQRVVLEGEQSNALFLLLGDLGAPEKSMFVSTSPSRAGSVARCGEALRGEFRGAAPGAEHFLGECDRAEFVFVLRPITDVRPVLIDEKTFQAGVYEGEVLLFRLADGALLGGFRVSAKSSDEVHATVDESGVSVDVIDRLEGDMDADLFADIERKLKDYVPGVIP